MHELAIAKELIDRAGALLPAQEDQIVLLRVELGALAGVSKEELAFGFAAMAPETPCSGAELVIEEIAATLYCSSCDVHFEAMSAEEIFCPNCGLPARILGGKELILRSMEIADSSAQDKQMGDSEVKEGTDYHEYTPG